MAEANDQVAWYDVWGRLKTVAADLDGAVAELERQRPYALARAGLAEEWQAKMEEIETARGRVTWLRDAIRSTMALFGVELSGLGVLPLIPLSVITAGIAYIASLASSAWELSRKIDEQQRLESRGVPPAEASRIVSANAAAGSSDVAGTVKTVAVVGGIAFLVLFVLPKLLPGGR